MKDFFRKLELPEFIRDSRLSSSVLTVIFLSPSSAVVGVMINPFFGLAMVLTFVLVIAFTVYGAYILAGNASNFTANLSYRIKRSEQGAMIKMPLGILLYDSDHHIQWVNPYLQVYLEDKDVLGRFISSVDPELGKVFETILSSKRTSQNQPVKRGNRQFKTIVQNNLSVIYLLDITHYTQIEEKYEAKRLAIGLIFIDNHDELSQGMHDQGLTLVNSYVQNTLSKYTAKFHAYLRRIGEGHFLLLTHMQGLKELGGDKFSVLDKVRLEISRNNTPLTLSIGLAYNSDSLDEVADQARSNLDLASGRDGDQVVLCGLGEEAHFFGEKSNPMEKWTRVRARVVSQALQEIFKDTDQVFVVGHQRPDVGAISGGIGIIKIARAYDIKAHVALDTNHTNYDVGRLIARLEKERDLDLSISPKDALAQATDQSLLVMADHSEYSITYDAKLYDKLESRSVIIDHHRRGEEFPENPMLIYIESYVSSTCELITEMVEYQPQYGEQLLTDLEATAILARIAVDSKEFSLRVGTRTFDAASYLRPIGADSAIVSDLLKEDIESFTQKTKLAVSLKMYKDDIVLLLGPDDKIIDPIVTAQAADMVLSLEHAGANFAVTRRKKDTIGISTGSIGDIDVQVIMEKLGGGGRLPNATTQLKDITIDEAKEKLGKVIEDYLEENEQLF